MSVTQISDILVDPDLVGESEYRAIYDLLEGVWKDLDDEDNSYSDNEKITFIVSVLNEFISSAEAMKRRIKIWKNKQTI